MFNFDLKELTTTLVFLGVITIGIALLGNNPQAAQIPLADNIRYGFAGLGSALLLAAIVAAVFHFKHRGAKQEDSTNQHRDPLAANLSEKSGGRRVELIDLRDAFTHINENFGRMYESNNSMKIRNIAFDLEMTAPWLILNFKRYPRLRNVSYRALVIHGKSKLIEDVIEGESDIRIEYLRSALKGLWEFINQQEANLRERKIEVEIRAYDLPPVLHGFMFNDQHLYLGLTHIEKGKVRGSVYPYWYLQFDNTTTTEHLYDVYNSWFDYTWHRSHKTLVFTRSEKFFDIKP